jgi:NAD(P)-dependent dehydrogenase (short-subunit alcohol dehydrogenase family)
MADCLPGWRRAIMPGRTIVITGASDGIGAAAARALSAAGERVVVES